MKRTRYNIFVLALILFSFPLTASHAQEKLFGAKTYTTDNGLEVILIENHRIPVVTHMVWYEVGAADEPVGLSGVAHYLEHLLFKGSPNVKPGEFSKKVRLYGGNDNAFTSQDYTAYFQTVSSQHLEDMMVMEADRMKALKIPEEEALSELQVVFEERRQRLENSPAAQLFVDMNAALYPSHPYGKPIIGWTRDLNELTLEKSVHFYNTHYRPDTARLVIAGDITMEELKPLVKKTYGKIKKEGRSERFVSLPPEPLLSNKQMSLASPLVRQASYFKFYRAPSWTQDKTMSLALTVMEEILDGGADSPLYQTLVVKDKIATSADLSYDSALGPGKLVLSATPAEGKTLEDVQKAFNDFIDHYRNYEWHEEDITSAITKIQDSSIFLRDSLTGPAMIVGQGLASGLTLEEIETYPQLLNDVTSQDLEEAFAQVFGEEQKYVEGFLKPATVEAEVNNEH